MSFTNEICTKQVKKVSVSAVNHAHIHARSIDVELEIAQRIAAALHQNGDILFDRSESFFDDSSVITGTVFIVEPTNSYINLKDNKFIVNNEVFTNEELVEAVKSYYAERLI